MAGAAADNVPTYPGMQGPLSNVLNTEVAKAIFELGVAWSVTLREIYTGNPTNNTSGGGRQYFYGLDTLINTGYRDAITGVFARRQHRALVRQPRHRDQRRDVSAADHQHLPQPALHRQ